MDKSILIIDDSFEEREIIKRQLEAENFCNVIEADSGEAGIEAAKENAPQVIILDTVMTGIDGFETCKRIKSIEGLDSKVIVCTNSIEAVDSSKATEMGADEYCVKTEDNESLLQAVKKFS